MSRLLGDKWWVLLLNGLGAIAFGILAFAWPGVTLIVLITLFGAYCIVDGVTALLAAGARIGREGKPWGWMLFAGIVSILAGIAAFAWPGLTTVVLLTLIAAWAIVRGVLEIVAAIQLRKSIDNEWMLALAGMISVAFGLVLLVWPGAGALALIFWIAAFAIVHGVLLTMVAFRVRRLASHGIARPA